MLLDFEIDVCARTAGIHDRQAQQDFREWYANQYPEEARRRHIEYQVYNLARGWWTLNMEKYFTTA